METTRRGFFGLVAGALASVPVLKRLAPTHQFPKYMTLGWGAIAPGTRIEVKKPLTYWFHQRLYISAGQPERIYFTRVFDPATWSEDTHAN